MKDQLVIKLSEAYLLAVEVGDRKLAVKLKDALDYALASEKLRALMDTKYRGPYADAYDKLVADLKTGDVSCLQCGVNISRSDPETFPCARVGCMIKGVKNEVP